MYFLLVVQAFLGSCRPIILPWESILNEGDTTWHNAKAVELPYDACFVLNKQDFATMSTSAPPTDSLKLAQYDSLMEFYNALSGSDWRNNDNWGYGDPCFYAWYGLECDCDGFVTKIILPDNRLLGEVPSALNDLVTVREIHFQTSTKAMHVYDNIDANKLSGIFPSIPGLVNLEVLDVSQNLLTGLPDSLPVSLVILNAAGNLFTTLPVGLSSLINLNILELHDNLIDDTWNVEDVCALTNIYIFNLGNSSLNGVFYDDCLSNLNPLVFDVSAPHPAPLGWGAGLSGTLSLDLVTTWTHIKQGYLSVYLQFGLDGHIPSTCVDLRFCRWFQFENHDTLAWTDGSDVPQNVYDVIEQATEH